MIDFEISFAFHWCCIPVCLIIVCKIWYCRDVYFW
uniref:Uncharacterized protein n=1 Tax=Rhizophora mucronata TaxID=61149 RepID=A0A2P2NFD2_RHIMU